MRHVLLFSFCAHILVGCGDVQPDEPQGPFGKVDDPALSECAELLGCAAPPPVEDDQCVFVLAFDGSGVYSPEYGTNVGKLYSATAGPAARSGSRGLRAEVVEGHTTRAYIEGVPSIVYKQSAERVQRGWRAVCQHLDRRPRPCNIVLLGYSRGAFIANKVAIALEERGCPSGRHLGARVAFLGLFDPVITAMGYGWLSESWDTAVPANVERTVQVYKGQHEDPRWNGWGLSTTTVWANHNGYLCSRALWSGEHPSGVRWHHGEVGHGELPRRVISCALKLSGISLEGPTPN